MKAWFSKVQASDGERIRRLFQSVFCESEGEDEGAALAFLVDRLVGELGDDVQGYIAEFEGQLRGAIFLTRLRLDDGCRAWLLSPVAVATASQGQGVGQALIRHGLAALADQGAELVVTYGDPAFYGRVGFQVISEAVIRPPFPLSQPEGWQCCALGGAAVTPHAGAARCVRAFDDPALW